jgi:hypothetical protein
MAKMDLSKIFILIGGLVVFIQALIAVIGLNFIAIIGIILGWVILAASGIVGSAKLKVLTSNWIIVLVLGIIALFVQGWIGGILTIIGAILKYLNK